MGFLERLRQEKEAAERATAEQKRPAREREEAIEAQRRQQQEEERQRHEMRRTSAQQFRDESRIGALVAELRKIIGGFDDNLEDKKRAIRVKDEDSVFDTVVWDSKEDRYASHYYWIKLIVAETCPDGTLVIHGGKASVIPQGQWKNDESTLESALEKAYYNPRRLRYYWKESSSSVYEQASLR